MKIIKDINSPDLVVVNIFCSESYKICRIFIITKLQSPYLKILFNVLGS